MGDHSFVGQLEKQVVMRSLRIMVFIGLVMHGLPGMASKWAPSRLTAEITAFEQSGTYAEVVKFCRDLERAHPSAAKCNNMGSSAQGRDIKALVVSKTGALDAATAKRRQLPVLLVIGGTHAGEIDGKDAGFILMRELLADKGKQNPLNHLVVVFVPVFNVDGHEARSRFSRPNQNGPLETGQRTNALRINLNRDWMLSQAHEMRAMLSLVQQWDPLATLDLHVTDGLRFRHDVSVSISSHYGAGPLVKKDAQTVLDATLAHLRGLGHDPLGFYPQLKDVNDPGLGVVVEADAPRFSHVYANLRNRMGFLIEDHAWAPYAQRVVTSKNTLLSFFHVIASMRHELMPSAAQADAQNQRMAGQELPMLWVNAMDIEPTKPAPRIALKGYAYEVFDDAPVVGGRGIAYDTTKHEDWSVPFYGELLPIADSTVKLPTAGYVIPTEWAGLIKPLLQLHGIRFSHIPKDQAAQSLEVMRVDPRQVIYDTDSFQGKQRTSVMGRWSVETARVMKGSLFIPIQQPKALLVAHLLEPSAPDSLSSWGLFNAAYETSDYVADHRELQLIRWMHEGHPLIGQMYGESLFKKLPQIRQDFEMKLATDESFRLDPQARVDFWMSFLPAQDPDLFKYPILRAPVFLSQGSPTRRK